MRIAQIAPLMESVPPRLYGGTERIVSWLSEELVLQGHDVTLFASADSITSANLVPCATEALRLNPAVKDWVPHYMIMLDRVRRMAAGFDILHFHIDAVHFPLFAAQPHRTVTTLHGRQDLLDMKGLYYAFPEMPLVSISDNQRLPIPEANFAATVRHGLPVGTHKPTFAPQGGGYLAFLGRISPEKRPDRAIEIAKATGLPLKIAAKIDKVDADYWNNVIAPMTVGVDVEFVGEINEREKTSFLGNALALLFPIDWPEPFGLVMIEAMACGTPVLAFDCGSVREVIRDGVTGRIVETMEEAIRAVPEVIALDRRRVRATFEADFTSRRMALDYVDVYRRVLASQDASSQPLPAIETKAAVQFLPN